MKVKGKYRYLVIIFILYRTERKDKKLNHTKWRPLKAAPAL